VEERHEIKEIMENPEEALWWQEEARQIHEKKEELNGQP
jgi:MFS transporter, MHS family, proline/betaine transporter